MVTRALNFKIVVPRGSDARAYPKALWITHREINHATRYYEELLLSLRQQPISYRDGSERSAAEALEVAKNLANDATKLNNKNELLGHEDALTLYRHLYEAIVPSSVGEKGTAQNANMFASPILDPESGGMQSIFEKIKNPPNWIEGVRNGEVASFEAAQSWLGGEQGKERLMASGAPSKWKKAALKKEKDWPTYFVEDYDKKVSEAEGVPTLIRNLRELGLLPLARPYFASRIEGSKAAVTPWDRLAIRLAVAHLLSWESWVSAAATEHQKRVKNVENFKLRSASDTLPTKVADLRKYETQRLEFIISNSVDLGDAPEEFRINQRMIRGWEDLRARWTRHSDAPDETLIADIAAEQTKKGNRFGDPDLYQWLAKTSNRGIWSSDEDDPVLYLTSLNEIEMKVERSRETATMTLPDPMLHPRSAQWEPKGGNNLRNFEINEDASGVLRLSLPLISQNNSGALTEETLEFSLAPSTQMQKPKFSKEGKKIVVEYQQSSGEMARAILGSADLMFNWSHFKNRELEVVENGDVGSVFFKMALDIEPEVSPDIEKIKPGAIYHFQNAAGKKTKHADLVEPGMRVLSVDLGLRSFATCSVFAVQKTGKKIEPGKLFLPISDLGLVAVHERSFSLKLPGEDVGRRGRQWQEDADAELRALRMALARHRSLRTLASVDQIADRLAQLEQLEARIRDNGWPFEAGLLAELRQGSPSPEPVWKDLIKTVTRKWRLEFGFPVSEWRKRQRNKDNRKFMGKSIWALDYLGRSRRFLLSWSLIGRGEGDIRRLDRERSGVFAAKLLDHMAGVKADRIKTGADLLVQAARGLGGGTSQKQREACQFILFEDLSRYRMRTDRPRRENSQLAKWSHREILTETTMQAEIYRIGVVDTGAAFSSRFYALNSAPGMRLSVVRKKDLENPFFIEAVGRENPHVKTADLKAGSLVFRSGGEDFVTLKRGKICRIQADVNAAQNLQRRLWTRHSEAIRLVTKLVKVDGAEHWVPSTFGERAKGAMGSVGYLVPTGHSSGSCEWKPLKPAQFNKLTGGTEQAIFEDDEELAGLADQFLERSGKVTIFFRDPSGEFLPANLWYPSISFWPIVKQKISAVLGP